MSVICGTLHFLKWIHQIMDMGYIQATVRICTHDFILDVQSYNIISIFRKEILHYWKIINRCFSRQSN